MKKAILDRLKKGGPLLVASLDGDDLPALISEAKDAQADVIEIRLDLWGAFFRDDIFDKMRRIKERAGAPLLVSFRGGHPYPDWWQPAYWRALEYSALVDMEWNPKYPWKDIAGQMHRMGLGLIISHHDFQKTPPVGKLATIIRAAYAKKADIVKIATRAQSEADIVTLLDLSKTFAAKRPFTAMGMGRLGGLSRLAGPLFGSCLVYGYIGRPTANGQLPYKDLRDRMRQLYPRYDEALQARLASSV
jgi:3-dehydroquinate dehydratase-1